MRQYILASIYAIKHLTLPQHFTQGVVTSAASLIEALVKKNPDEYKGCVSLAVSRLSRVRSPSFPAVYPQHIPAAHSANINEVLNVFRKKKVKIWSLDLANHLCRGVWLCTNFWNEFLGY